MSGTPNPTATSSSPAAKTPPSATSSSTVSAGVPAAATRETFDEDQGASRHREQLHPGVLSAEENDDASSEPMDLSPNDDHDEDEERRRSVGSHRTTTEIRERIARQRQTRATLVIPSFTDVANASILEAYLNEGGDVDAVPFFIPFYPDDLQWTLLHWAAYHLSLKSVELLMSRGANPTRKNSDGKLPLEMAKMQRGERLKAMKPATPTVQEETDFRRIFTLLGELEPPVI